MLIRLRRATAAQYAAAGTILALGEPAVDLTSGTLKIGDGVSLFAALPAVDLGPAILGPAVNALFSVPADIASLGVNVTQGAPHGQSQTGPGNRVYLSGQLSLAASTFANGSTLFSMPAGQLPTGAVQYLVRTVGSNTQFQLNISAAGVATNVGAIVVAGTDTLNLDGLSYAHA